MARIITFWVALVAAIAAPTALLFLAAFLSPPPYFLTQDLPDAWFKGIEPPSGFILNAGDLGHAIIYRFHNASDARKMTSIRLSTIKPSSYSVSHDGVARFHTHSGEKAGLIFPIKNYSFEIIGRDEAAVEKMEAALPYVKKNTAPSFDSFLQNHILGVIAGLLGYMVVLALGAARGASWATTVKPEASAVPASKESLERLLLDVNNSDIPFAVMETKKGRLKAEWVLADARWRHLLQQSSLKRVERVFLDFDERTHTVRVLERSQSIATSWNPLSLVQSLAFFQGIRFTAMEFATEGGVGFDMKEGWKYNHGYQYTFNPDEMKAPLAAAVLKSGWTWKPVVTLVRPLGG